MKAVLRQIALVLLAAVLLASGISAQTDVSLSWSDDGTNKTETRTHSVEVTAGTKVTRVKVKVNVDSGRMEWKLRDPSGTVRLIGEATGGKVTGDTGDLDPIVGTWTLELTLKNVSGNYNVRWTAH